MQPLWYHTVCILYSVYTVYYHEMLRALTNKGPAVCVCVCVESETNWSDANTAPGDPWLMLRSHGSTARVCNSVFEGRQTKKVPVGTTAANKLAATVSSISWPCSRNPISDSESSVWSSKPRVQVWPVDVIIVLTLNQFCVRDCATLRKPHYARVGAHAVCRMGH